MRRKMLVITSLLTASLMTGCAGEKVSVKPEKVSEEFHKTATVTLNGRDYTATLHRGGADIWECEFTEPECVAGLKLTTAADSCRMEFGELEYMADRETLPEYGMMPLLTKTLDAVIAGRDVSCSEGKDCTTEIGQISEQTFTAKVKNGEIVSVEIAGCMSAEFH